MSTEDKKVKELTGFKTRPEWMSPMVVEKIDQTNGEKGNKFTIGIIFDLYDDPILRKIMSDIPEVIGKRLVEAGLIDAEDK